MLKNCFTNSLPLIKPKQYLTNTHNDLYDMDREWAISVEKLSKRDLRLYDKDIVDVRRYTEENKSKLIVFTQKKLKILLDLDKDISSFKLSFNEYNGYIVEFKDKKIETYNYLNYLYINIILLREI